MNLIDFAAIALLIVAVLLGIRSGAMPQLGGLGGALLAAAAGLTVLPHATFLLDALPPTIRSIAVLAALLGLIGLGEAVGAALGRMASVALGTGLLGALDRVLGGVVGAAQAILLVWLAGGLLAIGPLPALSRQAQTSVALRGLDAILPAPDEIVTGLGRILDDSGLPDVFVGLEQLPAPGVDLPSNAVAKALGTAVKASVLRVTAEACQVRSSGTGFVVANGYLITNAHVIAGAKSITVDALTGPLDATTVFMDPELDVALLHVRGLAANPLRLATSDPGRGTLGATFGYPGGGPADIEPAAVTAAFEATGLDIEGRRRVAREILELRSTIDPGDSGGPFLLADGTVGGVVFAESKTDDAVGYALTPTAVSRDIAPWIGRVTQVSTGPCIH